MTKLKGLNELNKAISAEVKPFGISEAFCETEYSYYFDTEKVGFSLVEGEADMIFNEFIEDRFDYTVKNQFIISLLHEIGHHKANDDIDGEVYDFCLKEKERISEAMAEATTIAERRKLHFQYFNLPDEIMATAWAVGYAKKHPKKIKKMWENCEKALHKFYEVNEVTGD